MITLEIMKNFGDEVKPWKLVVRIFEYETDYYTISTLSPVQTSLLVDAGVDFLFNSDRDDFGIWRDRNTKIELTPDEHFLDNQRLLMKELEKEVRDLRNLTVNMSDEISRLTKKLMENKDA